MKPSFILLLMLGSACAHADQWVVPAATRKKELEQANRYILDKMHARQQPSFIQTNPFLFPDELSSYTFQASQAPRYPDAQVVEAVAKNLLVQGIILESNEQLLYIPQGKIRVGDAFEVLVQGAAYTIVLAHLTSDTFTLQLNDARWTQPLDTIDANKIYFDSP